MTKLLFTFISILITSSSVFANQRLLVISDIDDTIKVSSSRNYLEFAQLMDSKIEYTGMSDLFQTLKKTWGEDIQFSYVTNSPFFIKSSREQFLEELNYIKGPVYYSPMLKDPEHKYRSIKKLIQNTQPTHIIMLGDNSDQDPTVYLKIKNEYQSSIQFSILIHRMFKDETKWNEGDFFSYITSLEAAQKLVLDQYLNAADYQDYERRTYPMILKEIQTGRPEFSNTLAFPSFMNCRDFKWTLNTDLIELKSYLDRRCKK